MKGFGAALLALLVVGLAVNSKSIVRYIKISSM